MLPGYSSTPVSRQPMPRMWLSPSPRTLSHTPLKSSMRSWKGASGVRHSLSVGNFSFRLSNLSRSLDSFPSFVRFIRPEVVLHDAVGAEHDDQPPLALGLIRKCQARQIQNER